MSNWTFNGEEYILDPKFYGFVYRITNKISGRAYIGRKYFWSFRTPKGKKRKVKGESDWQKYWSSSDELKADVKLLGKENFSREILSLHELQRDVTYGEERALWRLLVIEAKLPDGSPAYYNSNIGGHYFPGLYADWESRAVKSNPAI